MKGCQARRNLGVIGCEYRRRIAVGVLKRMYKGSAAQPTWGIRRYQSVHCDRHHKASFVAYSPGSLMLVSRKACHALMLRFAVIVGHQGGK